MLRRLSVLGVLIAVTGCVQDPSVPRLGSDAVSLSVHASLREVHPGDVDTITVSAVNTTGAALRIVFSSTCQVLVYLKDATGRTVIPAAGGYDCVAVPSLLNIPANDSIVQQYVWDGGPAFIPPPTTTRMSAGTYFVTASLNGDVARAVSLGYRIDLFDQD